MTQEEAFVAIGQSIARWLALVVRPYLTPPPSSSMAPHFAILRETDMGFFGDVTPPATTALDQDHWQLLQTVDGTELPVIDIAKDAPTEIGPFNQGASVSLKVRPVDDDGNVQEVWSPSNDFVVTDNIAPPASAAMPGFAITREE